MPNTLKSSIRDNQGRGKVGDFLKEKIKNGSKLSFVFAYFTIYAYEQLKEKLQNIAHLNFLYGEPRFVKTIDQDKTDTKSFSGSEIVLRKNLKRNFISCEIHPEYYQMILDRLDSNGKIKNEYKLDFIRQKERQVPEPAFDFFEHEK